MVLALAALGVASHPPIQAAPGDPVGGEFQVNTYATGRQSDPAVAADGGGGFVVVWESAVGGGPDTSGDGIRAQRFDATGTPVGGEFQVNTYSTGDQFFSSVTALGSSGFVVLWESNGGSVGTDASEDSVQGQRFDATGAPVGGEFQVNTYTTSFQGFPMAAATPGGFVVVWHSEGSSGTDTDGRSIQGQRFDATGMPVGGEFQVNTYTTSLQRYPAVAPLDGGGFVVVWSSGGSSGTDTSNNSVQGQRFDSTGAPAGAEFQVNTYTTSSQDFSTVAPDESGGFIAVWRSEGSAGTDTSGDSIQARRFDAEGVPQGSEFQVNAYTTGNQFGYSVGPDGTGGLVIVWESAASGETDTSGDSMHARRFDAAGNPAGDQFQVNTYTTDGQNFPGVAPDGAGGFVVVWRSGGNISPNSEIRAQRFEGTPIPTTTSSTTTPAASTTTSTVRPGEPLEGRKLQLKAKPGRPDKSELALVTTDGKLTLGDGNQSLDDPVVHGGVLTITSATGDFTGTHNLVGAWKYAGKSGQNRGYKWKSRSAPIRSVLVKPGKLAVTGQGEGLGVDLDDDPNPVRIHLEIGAHTYCLEFGGDDRRFKAGRIYRAKQATAPATCP